MRSRDPILDADGARRLFAAVAEARNETLAVAYLDPKWRLIGLRHGAGERGRVRPAMRTIVRDVLVFDAAAVILAHNHPSGDPAPSAEDLAFTRACACTLRSIGVTLSDHLILARDDWTSLRTLGLL